MTTLDRLERLTIDKRGFAAQVRGSGADLNMLSLGGGDVDFTTPFSSIAFSVMVIRRRHGTQQGTCEGFPCSSRARDAVVDMRMIIVNTERPRAVTFCCEILSRCRDASVPDGHQQRDSGRAAQR